MTTAFDTRPAISLFSEGLTFAVMVGLTVASAATFAVSPVRPASPELARTAVVAKTSVSEIIRLPMVIVTGKRSG